MSSLVDSGHLCGIMKAFAQNYSLKVLFEMGEFVSNSRGIESQ